MRWMAIVRYPRSTNKKSILTSNVSLHAKPSTGLLHTRSGVYDKLKLIADPVKHTGWILNGGSPKYLSHAIAARSNLVLPFNGDAYINSTVHTPIHRMEGGVFGIGIIGWGDTWPYTLQSCYQYMNLLSYCIIDIIVV